MPDPQSSTIQLVRLPATISPAQFEDALRLKMPQLHGSLLDWVSADWFAVAQRVEEIAQASALVLADELKDAGALEGRRVTVAEYAQMAGMRDLEAGSPAHDLRDAATTQHLIETPEFFRKVAHGGKQLKIDWHLAAIQVPEAWALFNQTSGTPPWAGIRVGHIDTGYTEHPVFGFTAPGGTWLLLNEGKNLLKDKEQMDAEGPWWNVVPELSGPQDNLDGPNAGHGTQTASMITGLYEPANQNIDFPFYGVAGGAPVVPYRITDGVIIDHVVDLLAQAIRDAVDKNCKVISISLGALFPFGKLAKAIDHAYDKGVIICAAAGNVISEVIYPGRYNRVVTVGGATTEDGVNFKPWSGSSHGRFVDICGPADRIRRARTTKQDKKTVFLVSKGGDGTSYATALCAGLAVLWLTFRHNDLQHTYGNDKWKYVAAYKRLLQTTALTPPGWDSANYGAGVYQAHDLLSAPLPFLADSDKEPKAADPAI